MFEAIISDEPAHEEPNVTVALHDAGSTDHDDVQLTTAPTAATTTSATSSLRADQVALHSKCTQFAIIRSLLFVLRVIYFALELVEKMKQA